MEQTSLAHELQRTFQEPEHIKAGRLAELGVADEIRRYFRKSTGKVRLLDAVRVPWPDGKGKCEIDFLVVTEMGLLLIEIKNYGGYLRQDPKTKNWLQRNSRGREIVHEDPLAQLEAKKRALKGYLEGQGISYSLAHFSCLLVSTNDNLVVGRQLAANKRIVSGGDLAMHLEALVRKRFWGFWHEKKKLKDVTKAFSLLDALPTWDEMELNGGAVWRGDLLDRSLPVFDRSRVAKVWFLSPRSPMGRRFLPSFALIKLRSRRWSFRLTRLQNPLLDLEFQAAGQAAAETCKLCHLRVLTFGRR